MMEIVMKDMWQQVATTLTVVIISMIAFWLVEGRHFITESDAKSLVTENSPYVKDKDVIQNRLIHLEDGSKRIATALEKNTEVMYEVKNELASLTVLIPYMEKMMNKDGQGTPQ
jgi:hypothetical protein